MKVPSKEAGRVDMAVGHTSTEDSGRELRLRESDND